MKIAFLTAFYPPKWIGGTEVASKNLVSELKKRNDVEVITSSGKIPKFNVLGYLISSWIKLIRKDYDVVHCQSTFPALSALFSGKKYFVYCRGSDIYLARGWKKLINRIVLRNAKGVISLTKDMQNRIKKDYDVKSVIVPNGNNFEGVRKMKKDDDVPRVIYVGTLKKIKGVDYLLKSVASLKDNFELWIIGSGPEKESLQELSSDLKLKGVKFLGRKTGRKLVWAMSQGDVLVLPSFSEGFPNVILEGMSLGMPIIATDVGGVREILKEGYNGFVIPARDSKKMREKISLLIKSKILQKKFSKNNLKDVKKYSWSNAAKRLESLYNS